MRDHPRAADPSTQRALAILLEEDPSDVFSLMQWSVGLPYFQQRLAAWDLSGDVCLDFGCGAGNWALAASCRFGQVVGVHVHAQRLRAAVSIRDALDIRNVTFEPHYSPPAAGAVDCILLYNVLQYLGDRSETIRQGHRNPRVSREVIRRAVAALVAPVSAGGALTSDLGGPFFEEFESRSHVLNGCVYGLWALYDVIDGLRWSELTPLARDVESCLARVVPRFTLANGWSLYALDTYGHAPVASVHYHRSHIRMFTVLHARTGLAAFADAVERWHGALNSRSARCTVLARKCAQVIWMRDVRRLPLVDSIWA